MCPDLRQNLIPSLFKDGAVKRLLHVHKGETANIELQTEQHKLQRQLWGAYHNVQVRVMTLVLSDTAYPVAKL